MNAVIPPSSTEEPAALVRRRHTRRQFAKTLGYLGPALVLAGGVAPVLAGTEPLTGLRAVELLLGASYLVLMLRKIWQLRLNPFHQSAVAWLELAAAAILAIESYQLWHRYHEAELAGAPVQVPVLPWLYAAVAVVYVVLAFRMRQLATRQYLHLHAEGFAVRTGQAGQAHNLRWADIATVEAAGATSVLIRRTDGQEHRIAFDGLPDGQAHRDRLLAHLRKSING
ncbi:hypothetical protein [Hymenobacter glacialis]|uniref:Uncharacterized protein n=1 Tax=Hymenobacter glacialis TaxID=1908236 RepID=A0A1G1T2F9_9BACT|nr:hypothetical protein [Hymenobacter glacialis]OGX85058.1 hypothetical protein BEN48_15125 [Hymenobacter glacialis]